MNVITLYFLSFLLFSWGSLQPIAGQSDAKAIAYIDRLKKATASPNGWKADFVFQTTETQAPADPSAGREGVLFVLGSRYRILLDDMELFFDGKEVAQYLEDANELTLSKAEDFFDPEDLTLFNPLKLFDVQSKDFDMQFAGTRSVEGAQVADVLLKPRKTTHRYVSVLLTIDEKSSLPLLLKVTRKEGAEQMLRLKLPRQPEKITEVMVRFQAADHPGVETVDMR